MALAWLTICASGCARHINRPRPSPTAGILNPSSAYNTREPETEFAEIQTANAFLLAGTRLKKPQADLKRLIEREIYFEKNPEARKSAAAYAERRAENYPYRFKQQGYVVFPDDLKLKGYWLPTKKQRLLRSPGAELGKIYSTYRGLPSRPRLCVSPRAATDDPASITRCIMISQKADEFYLGEVANGFFHGQGTLYFTRGVLGPLSELFIFQGEFRYGWPFAGRIYCKRPARQVCEVFAAVFHGPIRVELVDSFGLFKDESALLLPELQEATEYLKQL
ncbi:MAG: hypothetical protein NXI24_05215 [bacterium]|nr:hypothetical protein [bacterium]